MTDENRRQNVADEVARAAQALRAADALLGLSLHADSLSGAYYAAFHMLRAILMTRGLDAKTHAGAIHVFNRDFIRPGLLPSSHNRLLAGLQRSREFADYDATITFSADGAQAELTQARAFVDDIMAFLRRENWVT
jgi:uncharacterized protein (UPF0332 family)